MLKYNLVVCDDKDHKFNTIVKAFGDKEYFNIQHFDSLPSLKISDVYVSRDIDILFLDLQYLNSDGEISYEVSEEDVVEIKEYLGGKTKVYVYTNFTKLNTDLLRNLSFSNVITDWVDYEDITNPASTDRSLLKLQKSFEIPCESQAGFRVLHISDLHFGKQRDYAGSESGPVWSDLVLDVLKDNLASGLVGLPDVMVVSGDLTHSSSPEEYDYAHTFLEEITDFVESASGKKLVKVIAPGNHDYCWKSSILCEHSVVDNKLVSEKCNDDEFNIFKWKKFIDLLNNDNSFSERLSNEPYVWIYRTNLLFNFDFIVYNSSSYLTYIDSEVKFDMKVIHKLYNNVKKDNLKNSIFVTHHPVGLWGLTEESESEALSFLYDRLGVRIILSGHKHKSSVKTHLVDSGPNKFIYEMQTGSMASKAQAMGSGTALPCFRLLNFIPNKEGWQGVDVRNYQFNSTSFKLETLDAVGTSTKNYPFS